MNNTYLPTLSKVEQFLQISYEDRTPEQRWAIMCVETRKQKNWRRSQLGEYFKVVTSTVCYWESGKTFPKNDIVYKMAELLGRGVDEIVSYLENSENSNKINKPSITVIYDIAASMDEKSLLELIGKLVELAIIKSLKTP
jgi:transcriptional regulator with XRE-family HTH domain